MKTLAKKLSIGVVIVSLLILSFIVFMQGVDQIAYAAPIEVSGTIRYSASSTVRYTSLPQPLSTGYTATYAVGASSYKLIEGSNFVYSDGSTWQFKEADGTEYTELDTEVNNFVLSGTYKRQVRIYDRTDYTPKEGEDTFFEYTISKNDPASAVASTYRASVGMSLQEVILPLGWAINTLPSGYTLGGRLETAATVAGVILKFTAPAGTEDNFLDLNPVDKTISVEVLAKPEIIFKGAGASQVTMQSSLITYTSETNKYSGSVVVNTFTNTGYNFRSFIIEGDASGKEYSNETNAPEEYNRTFDLDPVAKVIFIAQWDPKDDTKYKIEHYRQGLSDPNSYQKRDIDTQTHEGTTDATVTIDINDPEEPRLWKMDGFTFNKEKTETEDNYSGTIKANGSLILKLYYSRDSYGVLYSKGEDILVQGEAPVDSTEYKFEQRFSLQTGEGISKPGYFFVGWTDGKTKTGDDLKVFSTSNKYTMIAPTDEGGAKLDTLTLTAKFSPNTNTKYKVKHILALDDSLLREETLEGTTDSTVYALAVVPGYKKLAGYATQHSKEYLESGVISSDESLVLGVYYEIVDYTVSFTLGGTNLLDPETLNINDQLTLPEGPAKEGYTFEGWKINGITFQPGDSITILGSVKAEAIYTSSTILPGETENTNNNIYNVIRENEGLSGGAIAGISIAGAVVLGASVFSIIWFGIKKKTFKDMIIKRKKTTKKVLDAPIRKK